MPSSDSGGYVSLSEGANVYKSTTEPTKSLSVVETVKKAIENAFNSNEIEISNFSACNARDQKEIKTISKTTSIRMPSAPSHTAESTRLLGTMPAELDDIELRSVQLQQSHSRDSISNACDVHCISTDKGDIAVAVQGDLSKPAILTFHDLGLNYASTFTGFFNYPTMRAMLENFCVFHVTAPGQEENAPTFPENFIYPTMDELASQLLFVMSHFGLKSIIGFGIGAGANILVRFAMNNPDKVGALCLVNCSSTQAGWIEWGYQSLNSRNLRAKGMTQGVLDYLMWHHFGRNPEERNLDLVQMYKSYFERSVNPINLAMFIDSYVKRTDMNIARTPTATLKMPVLNITGSLSPHIDDTVTFNGRLDPSKNEFLKVDTAVLKQFSKLYTMLSKLFWIFLLIFCGLYHHCKCFTNTVNTFEDNEIRVCIGTNGRMSVPSNREFHYKNLKDRYTNCTYVDGNLEITWIQNNTYDLSFLQHIREVTGYVLISHVDVEHVRLPRLQIIRGRTLFKLNVWKNEFGLFVSFSQMQTLELPALRDILNGSVGMFNNYNLCHVRTIQWDEILSAANATNIYTYNFTSPERDCPACHSSCEKGCWGEGSENCQKFSKINCSPQCSQGRCFGPKPRDCCHLFCAGGCTGPTQKDCLACKNFYDDGECKQECPSMQIYNPTNYLWEPNPHGKYAYGATCVRNCPEHLLKDNGACVRTCPSNKMAKNGECVQCNGPCPKTCNSEGIVHSGNIDNYKDCTIIEGSLEILDQTFTGYQQVYSNFSFGPRFIKIHPDRLEVFSTVKEITGYLNIQGYHEDFSNLSYFRNLEVIGGRQLKENLFASLFIVKTSLKSLGLKSLKRVNSGAVVIVENKHLCFANKIDWNKIKKSRDHEIVSARNRDVEECDSEEEVCSEECSSAGCWGKGSDQCLECKNFIYKGTCLTSCKSTKNIYQIDEKNCGECHPECKGTCMGPNADDCDECLHVKDGKYCVADCSHTKYPKDGICLNCHEACNGCKGPRNIISDDGCIQCDHAIIHPNTTIQKCLKKNATCPDRFYHEWVPPYETGSLKNMAGKSICRPCHPRCKKCTQYGFHENVCTECAGYRRGEQCEEECPDNHFANEETRTCDLCHDECQRCRGPGPHNCVDCKNFKIFHDGIPNAHYHNTTFFNCTSICPPKYKYKIFPEANDIKSRPYCSSDLGLRITAGVPTLLIVIFITLGLVLAFLIILTYLCRQKAKAKKDVVKMSKVLAGCEDSEPLRPTNVGPNLTKLRIIKEAELRRGGILGMGAFGRVYKGVWVPEGENVKIPVAIKVLTDLNGSESSKEFLDEAYIMCSVEHPNLLKLHAVCMTSQMMLITQLMPLGCLLDYVRSNKDKIGSKALLNWSTQIARGMSYLEERRLVHRDLASRNVLVQTPSCIKVTDFGLSKLLDYDSDTYRAAGGKMPIKWLALECIRHRIFTSKSDVWSFGVTIWEILTYGGRPYENIPAKDVPDLIEIGHKLPQPDICSLDVYCILLSCWVLDADARPTFKQLAETFAEKARDPGRYLVIPGDKFMRLPSYTTQDEKDLIRTLAPLDSTSGNTVLDAEEYLQPKSRQQIEFNTNEHNDNHPKRYCTDPFKNGDDETDTSREVGIGNLRLDLPLDEDDYLMPTGPGTGSGYMDLSHPAIDNPEYLLNSNSNSMNIAIISGSIKENNFQILNNNNNNNIILNNLNNNQIKSEILPTQTLGIPLTNSGEPISEHDYYNDLQRELQPLHTTRSETTV